MTVGRTTHSLDINGTTRALILHAPSAPAPPEGYPLLLLLHGSTEDRGDPAGALLYPAERFERNYDEAVIAPQRSEHGLVTAYLSAQYFGGWYCWANGNEEVGLCASRSTGNDEAFVAATLDLVRSSVGSVDPNATYALGMSGGASMAWKLGCHAPSVEAVGARLRIGAVAGVLAPSLRACCCDAPSVVQMHGDLDTYVDVQMADDVVAWFAAAHGCDAADTSHPAGDVRLSRYECARSRLDYYRVEGGGHTLPGAPVIWSGLGPTSDFDGFGAIWRSWHAGSGSSAGVPTGVIAAVAGVAGACCLVAALAWRWRGTKRFSSQPDGGSAGNGCLAQGEPPGIQA